MKHYSFLFAVLFSFSTGISAQPHPHKKQHKQPIFFEGIASYYADKFQGRRMANGARYDEQKFTAASNKIHLGAWVRVSNLSNKKTVIVQITDRMNSKNKRLIDLSKAAAVKLGYIRKGLTKVSVEIISKPGK